MIKKKQDNQLNSLINKLEDKGLTVNVVDNIEESVVLKLNGEDALDVIVNKLVELSTDNQVTLSILSKVDRNNYEIYIK